MLDTQSVFQLRQLNASVRRSFDAGEANRIVNDPSVLPTIGIADSLDLSEIISNPANVLMMAEGGAILFMRDEPGIYEVHTSFLKNCRGSHAIEASLNAYRFMFCSTDCMTILTRIPAFNRPASLAARAVGFIPLFERKGVWPNRDGSVSDVRFYELNYASWLKKAKSELVRSGQAFHHRLEQEMARHGVTEKQHPDDECHDHYVGACVEMVYAGQPEKAVALYNRWARFSGYGQIALVARSPMVIDIGNAVLMIENNSFKVAKCR